MAFKVSLDAWHAALLTALGLSPLTACGGVTREAEGGSTGGAVSSGGAGGRSGAGGAGGSYPRLECANEAPVLAADGTNTGFFQCDGVSLHRAKQVTCYSPVPRQEKCDPGCDPASGACSSACTQDSDCRQGLHGYCYRPVNAGFGGAPGCYCGYGCVSDSECADEQICECGDPVGHCVPATCRTDAECGKSLCLRTDSCTSVGYICQTKEDECVTSKDCGDPAMECTTSNGGVHLCRPKFCPMIGRPFVSGGVALTASLARRADWCSSLTPEVGTLGMRARRLLAERWTETALMEHASIASFARFTLEAMSLGAPPAMLLGAQRAMADEAEHARDAFALASTYADHGVGPGAFALGTTERSRSAIEIVRATILEGCIGETIAAVDAAEALAHATDPAVRRALARVTLDEAKHAELAWRFVQWMLGRGAPAERANVARVLVAIVESEVARSIAAADAAPDPDEHALAAHGVLGERSRVDLRRRVLTEVALPCARALVEAAPRVGAVAHFVTGIAGT